ncbi:MAG: LysR family transcriptional regulator [Alphaproteobacteria bacterium]|nr:LysR family transcriptional regulator [Alphaproteobacteria bacterium]
MPDLNIQTVRAFVAVADEPGTARAGQRLETHSATLAARIRTLEKAAETPLLERSFPPSRWEMGRTEPTEAGLALLPKAIAALRARDAMFEAPSGPYPREADRAAAGGLLEIALAALRQDLSDDRCHRICELLHDEARSASTRKETDMRALLLTLALCVLSGAAAGDDLLGYTRYGNPYVDMDKVKHLVDAAALKALKKERSANLRACDREYEPELARLYDERRHDALFEMEKRYDECNDTVEIELARKIGAMLARKPADDPADKGLSGIGGSGIGPLSGGEWFTCVSSPVCVEYRIDDPADRQAFVSQCAKYREGRHCPTDGRRCAQTAPGRRSVTYGGGVSNAEFRKSCIATGGEFSCFGSSC